jgi:AmpD protein
VQFVSTLKRAWHAGDSNFMGNANCNDFSIGIELEGSDFVSFEENQYRSLFFLAQVLAKNFPLLKAITSHEYIAPKRKTDPGPFFDWNILERNLRALSISWEIFRKKI